MGELRLKTMRLEATVDQLEEKQDSLLCRMDHLEQQIMQPNKFHAPNQMQHTPTRYGGYDRCSQRFHSYERYLHNSPTPYIPSPYGGYEHTPPDREDNQYAPFPHAGFSQASSSYGEESVSQSVPQCARINQKASINYLPSAQIPKDTLLPPEQVIDKNLHLKKEAKASTLAVRLARDAFFGVDIIKQCTVSGYRGLPALPLKEMNELKQTMFELFPQYWRTPVEFEALWSKCMEAIGQAAKGDRLKKPANV